MRKNSILLITSLITLSALLIPSKTYVEKKGSFEEDTIDVWGYGNYGGTAYVYNGYIEMQSDGSLDTSEYMTILIQFPSGTFNTSKPSNSNATEVAQLASTLLSLYLQYR